MSCCLDDRPGRFNRSYRTRLVWQAKTHSVFCWSGREDSMSCAFFTRVGERPKVGGGGGGGIHHRLGDLCPCDSLPCPLAGARLQRSDPVRAAELNVLANIKCRNGRRVPTSRAQRRGSELRSTCSAAIAHLTRSDELPSNSPGTLQLGVPTSLMHPCTLRSGSD